MRLRRAPLLHALLVCGTHASLQARCAELIALRAAHTLPPLFCCNGSSTDACVWLDLCAVPISAVLCVCVCVAKRVSPLTPTNLPPSATPAPTNVPYKMGSSCSATSCGCPANYFRITDKIACGRAANAMGKNFTGLSTRKPAPSGCFDTGTGSIEFTDGRPTWKDPDGMEMQTFSLLCAAGVTIPACTPCCSLLHSLLRQFLP